MSSDFRFEYQEPSGSHHAKSPSGLRRRFVPKENASWRWWLTLCSFAAALWVGLSDRHQSGQGLDPLSRGVILGAALTALAILPSPPSAGAQTQQICTSLEVLILLDESGSIDRNDPHQRRIEAARRYVTHLGKSQEVQISLALAVDQWLFDASCAALPGVSLDQEALPTPSREEVVWSGSPGESCQSWSPPSRFWQVVGMSVSTPTMNLRSTTTLKLLSSVSPSSFGTVDSPDL